VELGYRVVHHKGGRSEHLGVCLIPLRLKLEPVKVSMYAATHMRRNRLAKPLALALALLSLVFFLQIAAHGHNDSRQDGACRVCQMAHVGVAPAVAAVSFDVHLVTVGEVRAEIVAPATQDSATPSSPRAPPSLNA